MHANERQVGGSHYRSTIQHWDYVLANDIPYLEAQVIKYLTRWRKKDGTRDLQKAQHYLEKLFEANGVPWEDKTEAAWPDAAIEGADGGPTAGYTGQGEAAERMAGGTLSVGTTNPEIEEKASRLLKDVLPTSRKSGPFARR